MIFKRCPEEGSDVFFKIINGVEIIEENELLKVF